MYVAVTASIGEAVQSLGKLAKEVEKVAKGVKEAAEPIGKVGAVIAAGIGGAVLAASKSNQRLAAEVEHIQEVLFTFASEVGDLFTPLVRRIGDFLSNLTAHFQRMSPGVKRSAASVAAWVAGIGLGVGVVGKLAATVEGLSKGVSLAMQATKAMLPVIAKLGPVLNGVGPAASSAWQALQAMKNVDVGASLSKMWVSFKGMLPTMEGIKGGLGSLGKSMVDFAKSTPSLLSSVGKMLMSFGAAAIPILAVAAAITAIVLLAGVLYKNWGDIKLIAGEAWDAMGESVARMMGGLGDVADKLTGIFVAAFDAISSTIKGIVDRALAFVAFLVSGSAKVLKPIAHAARMGDTEKALASLEKVTGKDIGEGIEKAFDSGVGAMAEAQARLSAAKAALTAGVTATVADAAKAAARGVAVVKDVAGLGLSDAMTGVKMMMADISSASGLDGLNDRLAQAVGWVNGKDEARIRQPGDMGATLRQKGYDQLQSYADEDSKREADRATEADTARAAKSLSDLADEADRAKDELDFNRDTSDDARQEAADAARAEMERAQESFGAIWEDTQRFAEDAKAAMAAARADLISGFLGRMGELGSIIDSAKKGFEAGGIWGALFAAIGELLMGSEQMATIIDMFNGIIGQLKDLFGTAATGLEPIVGAIGYLVNVIIDFLTPVMEQMGHAMESIAPIIVLVGVFLKMLAPAFELVGKATSWLLENVLKGLFEVLRYVGLGILYVIKGLASAWNGIISAIQWVFKKLGDISILGAHPLGFLKGWAKSMESAKVDTESLARSIQELEGLTWDAAMAKANETAEVLKNRDALADVNEALTNVPDLWKVALRRFDAQDEQDGPNTSSGSTPPPASQPPPSPTGGGEVSAPESPQAAPFSFFFNIAGYDIQEAMTEAQANAADILRRFGIRMFGTAAPVSGRYA
ncbi:hypothetical protein D7V97_15650 [Corallococcus sp. CA053C]|nr:hypothetical protein D7V97_15650 [Corallococcus sp. CA053C]